MRTLVQLWDLLGKPWYSFPICQSSQNTHTVQTVWNKETDESVAISVKIPITLAILSQRTYRSLQTTLVEVCYMRQCWRGLSGAAPAHWILFLCSCTLHISPPHWWLSWICETQCGPNSHVSPLNIQQQNSRMSLWFHFHCLNQNVLLLHKYYAQRFPY